MDGCFNCGYLDKSRKNVSEQSPRCYQHGCNFRGSDKYMCGWCSSDKDLKSSYLGCSNWMEIKEVKADNSRGQMTIDDWISA